MITSSKQLKDKIKNLAGKDSNKAQTLLRNYIMERFLERLSLSDYRDRFVLKGGMLVASLVGLDTRATMDIDTTVRSINLKLPEAVNIITEICNINLDDSVVFEVKDAEEIMEEHDYTGLRVKLEARLENLRQPIKIDISTGDVMTPSSVEYSYDLMLENRAISLLSYNIETLLGEKLETVIARGLANTRMRDFYDIHVLQNSKRDINVSVLAKAFLRTCENRNTAHLVDDYREILSDIACSSTMEHEWNTYCSNSFYIDDLSWQTVNDSLASLFSKLDL